MRRARAGDVDVAARCELALLGMESPTPEQMAGAVLRAYQAVDIHVLRLSLVKE